MVERVFPRRPSRCGAVEGSGQAGAGALAGTQQPLRAGSLAASSGRQAPCTASLVVPAPLGPRREAPGLLQLWGVLLRGESTALCVGSLGERCWWDFPARGISQRVEFVGRRRRTWFALGLARCCMRGWVGSAARGLQRERGLTPCPPHHLQPPLLLLPPPRHHRGMGAHQKQGRAAGSGMGWALPPGRSVWQGQAAPAHGWGSSAPQPPPSTLPAPLPSLGSALWGRDVGLVGLEAGTGPYPVGTDPQLELSDPPGGPSPVPAALGGECHVRYPSLSCGDLTSPWGASGAAPRCSGIGGSAAAQDGSGAGRSRSVHPSRAWRCGDGPSSMGTILAPSDLSAPGRGCGWRRRWPWGGPGGFWVCSGRRPRR